MASSRTQERRTGSSERTKNKADGAGEEAVSWLARTGLVARSVFYCMLVYLVSQLAAGGGKQANAHGALTTIASHPGGLAALAVTAAGFLAFGLARIWGALRDNRATLKQRIMTFVQGAFYTALTWVPLSYALGKHSTGSEQQHQKTASGLIRLPGGRELLFALGLVIVGVCMHQVKDGVDQNYTDGMDIKRSPAWVKGLVRVSGTVGIPARAAVFFPTGIFFMIAAVQSNPKHADGLDKELATLARHTWGIAVLAIVAFGLAVFALYSFLEARYRTVTKGK
jgi:hypothetical protein